MKNFTQFLGMLALVLSSLLASSANAQLSGVVRCREVVKADAEEKAAYTLNFQLSAEGAQFKVQKALFTNDFSKLQWIETAQGTNFYPASGTVIQPTQISLTYTSGERQIVTIKYNGQFSFVSVRSPSVNFDDRWFNCSLNQ